MPNEFVDQDQGESPQADASAFAVAHAIVDFLKRAFFSWLPFMLLWKWADWTWGLALAGGVAAGYALEALWKRLLSEGDQD